MKRGTKPDLPADKLARGTPLRSDREGSRLVVLPEAGSVPVKPEWLTPRGDHVWDEELSRITNHRMLTESDSSLFGTYCNLQGSCIQAWEAEAVPPLSALTELRRMSEMFGIAGAKSRVSTPGDGPKSPSNPFARNGTKPKG